VALGPLTNVDLQSLAPETFARQAVLQEAAQSVARFIIGDGSEQSGYVFSHPRLRELFLEKVLSKHERVKLQQRFITYGERWYAQHLHRLTTQPNEPTGTSAIHSSLLVRHSSLPPYLRQFWITHLALVEHWDLARAVLIDIIAVADRYEQPWAATGYIAEGSYAGYLAGLDFLWTYAEQQHNLRLAFRCALISASIRSLSDNLSPELLVGLVTVGTPEGKWSPSAALEHVQQIPDAVRQEQVLRAILHSDCDISYTQALEIAYAIASP
jgi:hypothetical protein